MFLDCNPLLLCDFYKMVPSHSRQYPKGLTKVLSYFTPRMSRLAGQNKLVMFGLQGFIKDYLVHNFNVNFFNRDRDEVVKEYQRVCKYAFLCEHDVHKVAELHDLGYLPISIRALPEGSRVDIRVPMFEISNTHPNFSWLTNCLETLISASLWHAMVSANVGYEYRKIVNDFYARTVDDAFPRRRALGDFSMRGQESLESAIRSSAGWLLSFVNTATVPSILWLEKNYNCSMETEEVGFGALSTEHSVMCSNFAVDGDEITMVKRLLTETYPDNSFSMVSDSYDYWNLVDNIIPQCKEEIMNHNGTLLIRGDSGNSVEVVTQTVFKLWEYFGGSINSKGFKVLCPKVKAIYGDAITLIKCRQIYEILEANGFACNNVALGVGSFSMQCIEEIVDPIGESCGCCSACEEVKVLKPFTRDTFGIAIKATYAEDKDGNPIMIYKDPKTDDGKFKKSQKGCCAVYFTEESEDSGKGLDFEYIDGLTYAESINDFNNMLEEVFKDGEMVREYTLFEVRSVLHEGAF